jgi:hypothetical protein
VNKVTDVLSQRPCIFSKITLQMNLCENILNLQHNDEWNKEVKVFIRQNTMMVPKFEGFTVDNDRLLRFKS